MRAGPASACWPVATALAGGRVLLTCQVCTQEIQALIAVQGGPAGVLGLAANITTFIKRVPNNGAKL